MVRCIICNKEVDASKAVFIEKKTDHYYAGAEGFVCLECWCDNKIDIGCGGDCRDCPLYYACWILCFKRGANK